MATGTSMFDLMQQRLEWIGARQQVLAQNIANVDTPSYVAKDITPFEDMLQGQPMTMTVTDPADITPTDDDGPHLIADRTQSRAPDGNAVSMESELVKIADAEQSQALALNLYGKYMSMFREAIGKG
jgi:flagellar basal-body rod protein FlgB